MPGVLFLVVILMVVCFIDTMSGCCVWILCLDDWSGRFLNHRVTAGHLALVGTIRAAGCKELAVMIQFDLLRVHGGCSQI